MNHSLNLIEQRLGLRASLAAVAAAIGLSLMLGGPARALPVGVAALAAPSETVDPAALRADFRNEPVSDDARRVADWIVRTADNGGSPFIIVDKKATKVFVFDGHANLRGASAALLGLTRGDDSALGIGDRKLSDIPPEQRTTPAGRFVASLGLNLANQDILWIDYQAALALHRVLGADTHQHRLERLAAHSALDRRITFGCINVPVEFYDGVVRPEFIGTPGIVYILPETKSLQEVFFRSPDAARGL
jgi:hypothetical protein